MSSYTFVLVCVAILSVGIALCLELGRRLGQRRLKQDVEGARVGMGAVEGAIFGLLGLLIAFTFSGANGRLEARRHLILREVNDIGTAWLRLDLLPPDAQASLRERLREYVDARLAAYRALPDAAAAQAELNRSLKLQADIWQQAVAACKTPQGQPATMAVLPALNAMFDIVTDRTMAMRTHAPAIVFIMLGILTLVSALLAGHGMAGAKRRSWLHLAGFTLIMTLTVFVIVDLEFPRRGLFRVDAADQLLVDLRQNMK